MEKAEDIFVSAIASGGSQAMFFKVNTIGEENFLQQMIDYVKLYVKNKQS